MTAEAALDVAEHGQRGKGQDDRGNQGLARPACVNTCLSQGVRSLWPTPVKGGGTTASLLSALLLLLQPAINREEKITIAAKIAFEDLNTRLLLRKIGLTADAPPVLNLRFAFITKFSSEV